VEKLFQSSSVTQESLSTGKILSSIHQLGCYHGRQLMEKYAVLSTPIVNEYAKLYSSPFSHHKNHSNVLPKQNIKANRITVEKSCSKIITNPTCQTVPIPNSSVKTIGNPKSKAQKSYKINEIIVLDNDLSQTAVIDKNTTADVQEPCEIPNNSVPIVETIPVIVTKRKRSVLGDDEYNPNKLDVKRNHNKKSNRNSKAIKESSKGNKKKGNVKTSAIIFDHGLRGVTRGNMSNQFKAEVSV
jgi:hypothetical protein